MTSRYLIDIENRKSKIIHVYRNGDKYNRAALVLLRPIEQQKLERIFKAIEEKLTLPYNKPIKRIFTIKGKEIDDPIMVKDQKYYVVSSSENFVNTRYGSIIKWAIIGPVKWSKFTDVFYEPPEQDDLSMEKKLIYRWKNSNQNSARLPSKMTKSMSAYPTDRKTTKPSGVMTLSMDQSKRPISEPSNDMKAANQNRNKENGYFPSSDDKNSSGDNSEGSPKILTSHNHRSMNQFLNDSLKMYQQKEDLQNGNDNNLDSFEKNENKSEEKSEHSYDNSKEREIVSLTNISENKKENELEKPDDVETNQDMQDQYSFEASLENIEHFKKEPENLNKSDAEYEHSNDISEDISNEEKSNENIYVTNQIISNLPVKDDEVEEESKTKEVDFTDNNKTKFIESKDNRETPENLDFVNDSDRFDMTSDLKDSENEKESSSKVYVSNLPEKNYADEMNNYNEDKFELVKHQISENENYIDKSNEIFIQTEDINKVSLDEVIGSSKFSDVLESLSNQETDESDMELDKHFENVEDINDQQKLSKSSGLKDEDEDNTSDREDEMFSEPVKGNFETLNEQNQSHLIEKDEKDSNILQGTMENEYDFAERTIEDHNEKDVEVTSDSEKIENENSETMIDMEKDLSKFKEKEIYSKSSSEDLSDNEDRDKETSENEEKDNSVIIRESIETFKEDISDISDFKNQSQNIHHSETKEDPSESSIKINSDEDNSFLEERLQENKMLNSPSNVKIELDTENDDELSEKSYHVFEEENAESERSRLKKDDLEANFNSNPKEQYDRINIPLKDSSGFDEDHSLVGQTLCEEKVQEVDFNNDKLEQFDRIDIHQVEPPNCIENMEEKLENESDHESQQINKSFNESTEKNQMEQYNRIDMTLDNPVHCIEGKRRSLKDVSDNGDLEFEIGGKVSNVPEVVEENDATDGKKLIDKDDVSMSETSDNEKDSNTEDLEQNEVKKESIEDEKNNHTEISSDLNNDEFVKNKAATIIQESFRNHLERLDISPNLEHEDTEKEVNSEYDLPETNSHSDHEKITIDNFKKSLSNHESEQDDAAVIIQKSFREHLIRKELACDIETSKDMEFKDQLSASEHNETDTNEKNNLESSIQLPDLENVQDDAAKIIQKTFRGHLVRKELIQTNKQLDAEEDLESEGDQHRSYDQKDSDDENDPEINFSLMKDATNDLNTEEILDDHSQLDNTYSDDAFALNNKF